MNKIRVMIVEDSRVVRELLRSIVDTDPRLEVAAAFESAEEALDSIQRVAPDVISMDIHLPGMNGFEATQRIMSLRPTPIVVIAGRVDTQGSRIGIEALRAGALAFLEKPAGFDGGEYEKAAQRICTQLAIMSQVKVVRQRLASTDSGSVPAKGLANRKAGGGASTAARYAMLGIVASTGGPSAVVQVLNGLGPEFPLPIALVQHITACFVDGFAAWLGKQSPFAVEIATHQQQAAPGTVYIPPGDKHLRVEGCRLLLDSSPAVSFQRPSGTVLFDSMARSLGQRAIGVLLTGMGDDGAAGMSALRKAGGFTIAEDESTAVVYGMPAEAMRAQAVCESLPLPRIGPAVLECLSRD